MIHIRLFIAGVVAGALLLQTASADAQCLSGHAVTNTAQGAIIGGVLGGLLGAATGGHHNRGRSAVSGVLIGGALGGAVGCWTAHEQAVAAAREDGINTQSAKLEYDNAQLRQYNAELEQKVARLRTELAQAQGTRAQLAADVRADQQNAREELGAVDDALTNVAHQISISSGNQNAEYLLTQEQAELESAQSSLREIMSFQV